MEHWDEVRYASDITQAGEAKGAKAHPGFVFIFLAGVRWGLLGPSMLPLSMFD